MTYKSDENRALVTEESNANLEALLRERHAFVSDTIRPGQRVLELGAGIGITERFMPDVNLIQTDVEPNSWIDIVASAEDLPFPSGHFDAVICIAALHHMNHPVQALREMERILKPGGKALIMEVHTSLMLRLVLAIAGHEYVDRSIDPFGPESCQTRPGNNWDGNNAIGDLIFADLGKFKQAFPKFDITHHRFTETFLFINSGGVNYKAPYLPLPKFMLRRIVKIDRLLGRIAPNIFSICQEVILTRRDHLSEPQ